MRPAPSTTIGKVAWIAATLFHIQAFNVGFGEEIALDRGASFFRNRSANRTTEI
jgi:hypothetical protein